MAKKERLDFIADLISRYQIDRQEEIVNRLQEAGIKATQATVSRDIKTLGIVKVPVGDKSYIYGLPRSGQERKPRRQHYIYQVRHQGDLLHLDVEPGTATVIKQEMLERFSGQLFSLISDDDSVLAVVKTGVDMESLLKELREW